MNFSPKQRRAAFVVSLLAMSVCGASLASTMVEALAPGASAAGQMTMTPPTGDSGVTFALSFPTVQVCPGDAAGGYLWGTFITSAANDPATLTFTASGSPVSPAGFVASLRDVSGASIRNRPPNLVDGIIDPPTQVVLSAAPFASVTPGDYWIGLACTKADASFVVQNVKYWATKVTIAAVSGAGPNNFTYAPATTGGTTTTSTTTTTLAGTTTTTVAGATTTTVAGAAQAATLTPAVPTAGASYKVTHPNCRVGDTITVTQPQSTPTSATATCALPVAGVDRPEQAAGTGTATVTFTAAPTAPGTYTVTSTGATSGTRTATFTIVGATPTTLASTGGIPAGGSTGSIPATGSSTTSVIVWGILLLVFGRMAILFGRKPKVISANR